MSNNHSEPKTETLAETENFLVWKAEEPYGETTYHIELNNVTVHFFEEEWDEFLQNRYPEQPPTAASPFQATNPNKKKEDFRNYEADARPTVREFYRQNHRYQTYEFAKAKRREFLSLNRRKMGIWEAAEYLNTLVDDSDPDTEIVAGG